ncbi:MAG: DUF4349 domain-containing protein [Actinobacteria bacterium]|nr:DUF4349 domain-containing protein [Actinomycetota bacterium]
MNQNGPRNLKIFISILILLILGITATLIGGTFTSDLNPQKSTETPLPGIVGMYKGQTSTERSGDVSGVQTSPTVDRKIVKTADVTLKVEKGTLKDQIKSIMNIAERFGGYTASSSITSNRETEPPVIVSEQPISGVITIRVPAKRFNQAISEIGQLGAVISQSTGSSDVTSEYVDLEAQLKQAESVEKAMLELLNKAQTVEQILAVRDKLTAIQTQIEQLKGRLKLMKDQADFSTITVNLYEPEGLKISERDWGFVKALKEAIYRFVDTINGIIILAGMMAPILIIIAIGFGIRKMFKKA